MRFFHALLCLVERLFPLIPDLPVTHPCFQHRRWQIPSEYYFTWDRSYRLWQRLKAVLCFDRSAVSFWRKRQMTIKAEDAGILCIYYCQPERLIILADGNNRV